MTGHGLFVVVFSDGVMTNPMSHQSAKLTAALRGGVVEPMPEEAFPYYCICSDETDNACPEHGEL